MRAALLALVVLAGCPAPPPKPVPKPIPEPVKPEPVVTAPPRPKREVPTVTVAQARSRFSLEVLGIEVVGTIDPAATEAARGLTVVLRSVANADPMISLGKRNSELIDAKVIAGCMNDELPCMQKIAAALGADRLIYGIVNDLKGEYYVHLTMLDAKRGVAITWTGTTLDTHEELEYAAKVALSSLLGRSP